MVWLYWSPIPVGRRGVFSSFKWFLPAFATRRGRGGGVGTLWLNPFKTDTVLDGRIRTRVAKKSKGRWPDTLYARMREQNWNKNSIPKACVLRCCTLWAPLTRAESWRGRWASTWPSCPSTPPSARCSSPPDRWAAPRRSSPLSPCFRCWEGCAFRVDHTFLLNTGFVIGTSFFGSPNICELNSNVGRGSGSVPYVFWASRIRIR